MEINLDYIKGVVETTMDFFESSEGRINQDKELNITYEQIKSSSSEMIIGTQINFTWRTWVSDKWDKDHKHDDNYIKVLNGDKLSSFISDVYDVIGDIHKANINY